MSKMKIVFEPTLFTPAEVARITGLTTSMQRDWRSRGFLPKSDRHARFDAAAVAKLMVMQALAHRTIGPLESRAIASQCAAAIVTQAMVWVPGAWEGDPAAIFDGIDPKDRGPTRWDKQWDRAIADERENLNGEGTRWQRTLEDAIPYSPEQRDKIEADRARRVARLDEPHKHYENEKLEWMLEYFAHPARPEWAGRSVSDIVWWPTGDVDLGGWENLRESMPDDDPRLDGAAVVLPVHGFARQLVLRAQKPLLSVRVENASAAP